MKVTPNQPSRDVSPRQIETPVNPRLAPRTALFGMDGVSGKRTWQSPGSFRKRSLRREFGFFGKCTHSGGHRAPQTDPGRGFSLSAPGILEGAGRRAFNVSNPT